MRKFILSLVSATLLTTSGVAQCTIKAQYPGSGPAPKSYCWDIYELSSTKYGQNINFENVSNKNTTVYDHGGGEITVKVDMFGYGKQPNVQMNYKNFSLYQTQNIINQYKILVGTRYWFKGYDSKNLESGTLYVKDYSTTKDQLYVK